MGTNFIPTREAQLVPYGLNFKTRITATPTVYSLTAAQATAFGTLYDSFVTAYNISQSDATNSKSATIAKNLAKKAMIANLRMLAGIVQKAPTTTDTMRSDLGLTVRKTPSYPGNPGTAYKFKAALTAEGALDLGWKCTNPTAGTMYQLFRKIGAADPVYIGGTGEKKFTDDTLPAGTANVTYLIQAVRSSGVGAWADFNVKIGVNGAGTTVAAVPHTDPVKIAA
ncbi:MAG: hypothetical protein QM770_02535 [Tepidisphaeraceae bacterium]